MSNHQTSSGYQGVEGVSVALVKSVVGATTAPELPDSYHFRPRPETAACSNLPAKIVPKSALENEDFPVLQHARLEGSGALPDFSHRQFGGAWLEVSDQYLCTIRKVL